MAVQPNNSRIVLPSLTPSAQTGRTAAALGQVGAQLQQVGGALAQHKVQQNERERHKKLLDATQLARTRFGELEDEAERLRGTEADTENFFSEGTRRLLEDLKEQFGGDLVGDDDLNRVLAAEGLQPLRRATGSALTRELKEGWGRTLEELRHLETQAGDAFSEGERKAHIAQALETLAQAERAGLASPAMVENQRAVFLGSTDEARARKFINDDPHSAEERIRALDHLDPSKREILIGQARGAIKAIEAEQRAEEARRKRELAARNPEWRRAIDDYTDSVEAYGTPKGASPIDLAEKQGALDPDQLRRARTVEQFAAVHHGVRERLANMDPVSAQMLLESVKPPQGAEEFDKLQAIQQRTEAEFQEHLTKINKDPAAWAESQNPAIRNLPIQQKLKARKAQQDLAGILPGNQRRLTQRERDTIADLWAENPTATGRIGLIQGLRESYGNEYRPVLRELVKEGVLTPDVVVLPDLNPKVAADVAAASAMKPADLAKLVPEDQARDVLRAVKKEYQDTIGQTIPDNSPEGIQQKKAFQDQAEGLALLYASRGEADPAAKAVRDLFNERYSYQNGARVPKVFNKNVVVGHAARLLSSGDVFKRFPLAPRVGVLGLPMPDRLSQWVIQQEGEWRTNDSDTGLALWHDGQPVRDANDRIIEIMFAEAEAAGRALLIEKRNVGFESDLAAF